MTDILVRLSYVTAACTCGTKTAEVKHHDELCIYRVICDAETEILSLRGGEDVTILRRYNDWA